MCGIFGWILPGKKRRDQTMLTDLTDRLAHRGPDGSGFWLRDTADERFQIGFGHRRLSIIDLEGGTQPMHSKDNSITITFNGEIYNYIELRDELVARGHVFHTSSDTEVLIEAYRAWGIDAVRRFRGMFAFALWDAPNQRAIFARDPFGKKPFFFTDSTDILLFSSEINPLLEFPGFDRTFNFESLHHYMLNRYVPGPATFFKSIKKLPPGCYAVWQKGALSITRYFIPPIATTEPDVTNFDEAVDMFEDAFCEATRIRMRSDAPFGAYLSGGIDSSAVVAMMRNQSATKVRTFSVGFSESAYSELGYARTVATQFDTDHHEVIVDPNSFMTHWPIAVLHRGAPVSEASDIPILILSKLASRTVKMVLTGEGSDELLGGYPKHRAERWVDLYQKLIPHVFHKYVVLPTVRHLPYGMRRIKTLAEAIGERNMTNRMRVWFGGTSIDVCDEILGCPTTHTPPEHYPFSAQIGSSVRRTLFFDQTSWLPDNLLERGDRMMMAASIEGRMPFMDTALAAIVARFPDKFLIGGGGGKMVLRAMMKKVLPPEIINRKKVGFRVPFDEWIRGQCRDFIRDTLTSEESHVARICNRAVVERLVNEHIATRTNHEKIIWSLVNLEMFFRTFKPTGLEAFYTRAA